MKDRLDGFLNHSIGVTRIRTQKRWLRPKEMVAGRTEMDTDSNQQKYWLLQVNVNGHTAGGTVARGRLATAVTGRRGQEIGQFTNLAERVIDRGQSDRESFLHIVVQIFYHARLSPAYKCQLRSLVIRASAAMISAVRLMRFMV